MEKQSDILTELQPHQRRAVLRALAGNLVIAHGTGSGKTLTSLATIDRLGRPATVLTPASLVANYRKEIRKHLRKGPHIDVISLPTAVRRHYEVPKGNTLVLDEAHAIRNPDSARAKYVQEQARRAGRVLALSGTPAYNRIEDWEQLLRLVNPGDDKDLQRILPNFHDVFVGQETVPAPFLKKLLYDLEDGVRDKLKHRDLIRSVISRYVDVQRGGEGKPEESEETVKVPMEDRQFAIYKGVMKNMPLWLRIKIMARLPPNKKELREMNSFLTGIRQVSNSTEAYDLNGSPGPKLKEAVRRLLEARSRNPDHRALVYSNFLQAGVDAYAKLLEKEKIPYAKFTGALSPARKAQVVKDYNSGKVPVILGSGSASEGLDLKGTNLIQILEPHWNNARLDQVIGRGIRIGSHDHLPEALRKVLVQRFLSTYPEGESSDKASVDVYLKDRADEKDRLIDDFIQELEKAQEERK